MSRTLGSEISKALTTRSSVGLAAGAAVVMVLIATSVISSQPAQSLDGALREAPYFLLAAFNVLMFALLIGIRVMTDDVRYGTIVPTLLATPSRRRVVVAKGWTAAMLGASAAVVAQAVLLAVAIPMLEGKGVRPTIGAADVQAMSALVVTSAVFATIGVGVAAAIRHQVAAIVGGLVWMLVIENLGTVAFGAAAQFLPGQAAKALVSPSTATLAPLAGAAVLGAYLAVSTAIGALVLERRDVVSG